MSFCSQRKLEPMFRNYILTVPYNLRNMNISCIFVFLIIAAKSLQSCPILCDPVDGGPPGSPAPGILQTRTGKNLRAKMGYVREVGSIPGWRRSPGRGHGNPLQYSCLENPLARGAWGATVHGVPKSRTQLK